MIQDILMAIPLGILLCFMIGPVFFILLETAATKGFKAALMFDLGVVSADIIFISIAYFSSYRLLISIKDEPALYIFGGLIMVTYGLISYIKLNKIHKNIDEDTIDLEIIKTNYWSLYLKGLFLNIINIGVFGFWLLVFISFAPFLELKLSRLGIFFSSVIITYLLVDICKMFLAKKLKSKMTPINILKIKKLTSILLIIFGLSIIIQGWYPSENKLVKKVLEKVEPKE